ncbi:MAG: hypothetical protein RLZZ127_836, partial [Planctomycetota bacterium]
HETEGFLDRLGSPAPASAAAAAEDLVRGLRRLVPASAGAVAWRLSGLPRSATAGGRGWAADLQRVRGRILKPLEETAARALKAQVPDIAHRYVSHVLAFHPDHPVLRRNLGLVRVGERWLGPRDLARSRAGLAWDAELGWIVVKDQARYRAGEYFDLQAKRWTTLPAADAAHAALADPWIVETEHLHITGTAPLRELVATATRLEAFYTQIFAAWSRFFGNDPDDMRLVFGLLEHEPLRIHVARDKDLYQAAVRAAGSDPGWSAGMWIPRVGSSYFIAGSETTTYHEFTHQVLGVFTGRERAPAWLVEGAAQYAEAPDWQDGELVLGVLERNRDILRHLDAVRENRQLDIERLLAIDDGETWSAAADPHPQYRAAAAFAWWCMEADGRRWRDDFTDYLREAYRGESAGRGLWDYLGLTRAEMLRRYREWERVAAGSPRKGR